MDALDQKIYALDAKRNTIFQDQERVRENLKSLNGKSDIQQKYLEKLEDQEEEIAHLDKEKEKMQEARRDKQGELQALIAKMTL